MVVDDDAVVRSLVASILRRAGYVTREAADGREAVELLKAKSDSVQLLLTDLAMPMANGIELIREALAIRPNLSVLAMSADARNWAQDLFGIPLLAKPFLISTLLREVESALTEKSAL